MSDTAAICLSCKCSFPCTVSAYVLPDNFLDCSVCNLNLLIVVLQSSLPPGAEARRYLQPDRHRKAQRDRTRSLLARCAHAHPPPPHQPHRGTHALEPRRRIDRNPAPRRLTNRAPGQHGQARTLTRSSERSDAHHRCDRRTSLGRKSVTVGGIGQETKKRRASPESGELTALPVVQRKTTRSERARIAS